MGSAIVAGAALTVWGPSVVAGHYANGMDPEQQHLLSNPHRGWAFLADAVRSSRGARLGSHERALEQARDRVWTGSTGRAVDVRLRWTPNPFAVPDVPGGAEIRTGRRRVRPISPFSWVVEGRVERGPRQIIGLLDYRSGQVIWDIRTRVVSPADARA